MWSRRGADDLDHLASSRLGDRVDVGNRQRSSRESGAPRRLSPVPDPSVSHAADSGTGLTSGLTAIVMMLSSGMARTTVRYDSAIVLLALDPNANW